MLVTERPDLALGLLTRIESNYGEYIKGEKLVHIKELTLCLRKAWYDRHGYGTEGTEGEDTFLLSLPHQARTKIALGTAFGKLANEVEDEVSILFDDIKVVGHVDLTTVENEHDVPHEIKVTWSHRTNISPQYVEQLAAYCVAYGEVYGRLMIVKVNEKGGPVVHCFEYEFTETEMVEWRPELGRRVWVIVGDELPSFTDHWKWECNDCLYNMNKVPDAPCEARDGKAGGGWFVG